MPDKSNLNKKSLRISEKIVKRNDNASIEQKLLKIDDNSHDGEGMDLDIHICAYTIQFFAGSTNEVWRLR